MATCKDCIHYEACHDMYYEEHATRHFDPEKHNAEKECGYFKDRSRFVELPCGAGDTVYYIANVNGKDIISSAVVDEVAIYKSGTIGYDCGVGEIGFSSKSIGKRVFLTEEQAEQALREREDNV